MPIKKSTIIKYMNFQYSIIYTISIQLLIPYITYLIYTVYYLSHVYLYRVISLYYLLSISLRSVNEENGERNEKEMERIM